MGVIINEFEAVAEGPATAPIEPAADARERKGQAPDPIAVAAALEQLVEQAERVWAH